MFTKYLKVNFIITNVLIPMVVLILYCVSFAYFSSRLLPEGVNYVFVSRLWKYAFLLLIGVCLMLCVIIIINKGDKLAFKYSFAKLFVRDFLLLLLPLTPVVQYILNNQNTLSLVESLSVLVFFVFISGLYIFVIPELLGIFGSTRILIILGLAFVLTITCMPLLSDRFHWFGYGSLKIQLPFFAGVFLVTWLIYNLQNKWVLYIPIIIIFVANSTSQLLSQDVWNEPPSLPAENQLISLVDKKTPVNTPNVYLLVYDSYVANETMLAYGIDNSDQESYLQTQGFTLYPHTYSIEAGTLETMSLVFTPNDFYGDNRRGVSGDGMVQHIFSSLGYETYGIFSSDYMFQGIGSSYDLSVPGQVTPSSLNLIRGILLGEFRFNLSYSSQPHDQFVETKQNIFKSINGNQVFVYMHTDRPSHSQNSGVCLPNEIDLWKVFLIEANIEMRQDITTIIKNDPTAIVIIAADHGPYMTKNCTTTGGVYDISEISRLDIQDRYGTFLAIKWPTEDFIRYDDITVIQDIFPAIFTYIYNDVSILDSKMEPLTDAHSTISGVYVDNGIIQNGINAGEPLFLSGK